MGMVPSPVVPLAEHVTLGHQCWDVSIGSVGGGVCLPDRLQLGPDFFSPPHVSPIRVALPTE